jgi:hypothetical protein
MTPDNVPADLPPVPDPAAEAQATALIRLLEADGCILHDEWYPEPGVARMRYTRRSDNHDQMWEIEVRPWTRRTP